VHIAFRGLPFIRTYPLDEIGRIPRALRLNFDSFGRLAVMYDGVYSVLNDTTWVDRIDPTFDGRLSMTSISYADGNYFYGGRGSWGTVTMTESGLFRAHSLVSPDAPPWTAVTAFNGVLPVSSGVLFYDINGAVYFDFAEQKNYFFPLSRINAMFHLRDRVFVCCEDRSMYEIILASRQTRELDFTKDFRSFVSNVVELDHDTEILGTRNGELYAFDGAAIKPWDPQQKYRITGRVSAMTHLVEGGMALAIEGEGIYIFAGNGDLRWFLRLPEFRRVSTMAAGERGVLWAAGENAIHKIFYNAALTSFGEESGLPVIWPQVVQREDKTIVSSDRMLYELTAGSDGQPARFQHEENSPETCNCTASRGRHFLVGTALGVFARDQFGKYQLVLPLENIMGLEFVDQDTCIVIGTNETTALRYKDGWSECAPRIKGVGDAPIRITLHNGVWIEMGGDRIMRVRLENGVLQTKRVRLPWEGGRWTNIGIIGKWMIFSDSSSRRCYYDETTDSFHAVPTLDRLLARSPYWITRIMEDASGTLWGTHAHGVVTFKPTESGYVVDSSTFELRNDSYPTIAFLPASGVWIVTGRALYHVEPEGEADRRVDRPLLVSLVSERRNEELLSATSGRPRSEVFAFNENSLSFRFFSGTYAWRNPPLYEYRISYSDAWAPMDRSLLVHLPKLQDGKYRLQVRSSEPERSAAPVFSFDFTIRPPWYRTPVSYMTYGVAALLLVLVLIRWTNHHSLKRTAALEILVAERTKLLETTMRQLEDETRTTATMAERSRLAGEIHDSLQQGLSGSIIQLDTTLANSEISADARARLDIVRNMLSYIREEIQHAVWNLESPLLQNSSLGDALKKLAGFINTSHRQIEVLVPDAAVTLDSKAKHNLLRIAQEAITNAVKHSNADRIDVVLAATEDSVSLTVSDNGQGFDPKTSSSSPGHFGLRGMRTRAKSMKADFQVQSISGQGTTIKARVPIEKIRNHESVI